MLTPQNNFLLKNFIEKIKKLSADDLDLLESKAKQMGMSDKQIKEGLLFIQNLKNKI